jgi:hypothetical protein
MPWFSCRLLAGVLTENLFTNVTALFMLSMVERRLDQALRQLLKGCSQRE